MQWTDTQTSYNICILLTVRGLNKYGNFTNNFVSQIFYIFTAFPFICTSKGPNNDKLHWLRYCFFWSNIKPLAVPIMMKILPIQLQFWRYISLSIKLIFQCVWEYCQENSWQELYVAKRFDFTLIYCSNNHYRHFSLNMCCWHFLSTTHNIWSKTTIR